MLIIYNINAVLLEINTELLQFKMFVRINSKNHLYPHQ